MTPRARSTPAQEGFILIEVLVSALILAIVAGAVLSLIAATTRSAATERTHSVAYGLAQEDQARLRTMRIASLIRIPTTPQSKTIDGTRYEVVSKGQYISNSTGTTSCNGGNAADDYVQITSTVSSPALRNPVTMTSSVSPSSGSLDPSHGNLAFGITNGAGLPLSNVSISGTGPSNINGRTDANGCANFADIPAGNYQITTSAGGMINPKGERTTTKEIGVPAAGTQPVSMMYDNPSSIPVQFKYRVPGSPTEQYELTKADTIMVANAESGALAKGYGTAGGTRVSTITAPELFPYKTKYTVYAGSCESNNPDPEGKEPANDVAMAFVQAPSGTAASPIPVIQLPALNLKVTYNSAAVSGARVTITDTKCKSGSNFVKRSYTSNGNGQPSSSATGLPELGLPWGEYKICASAFLSSRYRRLEATKAVKTLTAAGTALELSLSSGSATTSTESSNQC